MNYFSIIIPCRSINNFLRENIAYLKKLDYSDYEVLIVLDKLEVFPFGDERFKILESGPISPGEKRNLGATFARGNILVFLDDDAYPSSDWLQKANHVFMTTGTYALGAPAITPPDAPLLEKCSGHVLESILTSAGTVYRHTPLTPRMINDYPTVNLFVKRDAFASVGGFTKEFWPGEDTKLCLDLIKKFNSNFIYDPTPIVYHHRRTLFRPHLKQISRYGKHRGQFARIFPENSRNPSYFIPSFFVLGVLFGHFINLELYAFILSLYLGLVLAESIKVSIKNKHLLTGLCTGLGIVLTHFIYGINFIVGFIKKPKLKLKKVDTKTGNYSEG